MQLAYEELGLPPGPVDGDAGANAPDTRSARPLVALHPVGLSAAFWPGFGDRLGRRRRIVAIDTAGHGRSPDSPRPGRMADRVTETAAAIEAAAQGPVAVLGVSFGGMIAMQLALARPDLVGALLLGACPPRMPAEAREAILDRGRAAESGGMAAVVETTVERWFSPGATHRPIANRVRERLGANAPSNWAAAWEAVAEHDALPRLGQINVPTLVIAGEKDASVPLAAKKALADAISGARLAVIPDAPHMIHLERTVEFLDIVDGFLTGLEA